MTSRDTKGACMAGDATNVTKASSITYRHFVVYLKLHLASYRCHVVHHKLSVTCQKVKSFGVEYPRIC